MKHLGGWRGQCVGVRRKYHPRPPLTIKNMVGLLWGCFHITLFQVPTHPSGHSEPVICALCPSCWSSPAVHRPLEPPSRRTLRPTLSNIHRQYHTVEPPCSHPTTASVPVSTLPHTHVSMSGHEGATAGWEKVVRLYCVHSAPQRRQASRLDSGTVASRPGQGVPAMAVRARSGHRADCAGRRRSRLTTLTECRRATLR
jgi:hypothetical protein